MTLLDLAEVLEAAAGKARELAAVQRADRRDWQDQASSPLGSRRHVAAARRRMTDGADGVAHVGRRWLLSPEALREELCRLGRPTEPTEEETPDYAARMRSGLRALDGGRQ